MSVNYETPNQSLDINETLKRSMQEPKYSGLQAALIGIFLSSVIFLSMMGNFLVVIAVFTERSLRKTTNFFYVSLAIADMLVSILVMTFALANDILGYWIFGAKFCSVWISFDIMCSTASILNLCTISLDRYIHIKYPLRYESCMTPMLTLAIISCAWILSALISFLPIQLGWHTASWDQQTDDIFLCYLELNSTYAVVSSVISFFLPCAIMIGIYYRMYKYATMHVKSIQKQCGLTVQGSPTHQGTLQNRVSDQKAAITLGVIMGTFLFCWFPFFTMNIVAGFCSTCVPNEVFSSLTWLGYVNSSLNPIIYSIFNKEFRKAFYKILCIRLCCCRSDNAIANNRHTKFRNNGSPPTYHDAEVELVPTLNGDSRKLRTKIRAIESEPP